MQRQVLDPGCRSRPRTPREESARSGRGLGPAGRPKNPLKANLVKLRYFAGLSLAEAAAALGLSERAAGRHWAYARAWLRRMVEGSPE